MQKIKGLIRDGGVMALMMLASVLIFSACNGSYDAAEQDSADLQTSLIAQEFPPPGGDNPPPQPPPGGDNPPPQPPPAPEPAPAPAPAPEPAPAPQPPQDPAPNNQPPQDPNQHGQPGQHDPNQHGQHDPNSGNFPPHEDPNGMTEAEKQARCQQEGGTWVSSQQFCEFSSNSGFPTHGPDGTDHGPNGDFPPHDGSFDGHDPNRGFDDEEGFHRGPDDDFDGHFDDDFDRFDDDFDRFDDDFDGHFDDDFDRFDDDFDGHFDDDFGRHEPFHPGGFEDRFDRFENDPFSHDNFGGHVDCGSGMRFIPDAFGGFCEPEDFHNQFFDDGTFEQFHGDDFDCPPGDFWCEQKKASGEGFGFHEDGHFGFEDVGASECMDSFQARSEKFRVVQEIQMIENDFAAIDLSQAGTNTAVLEAKRQLDKVAEIKSEIESGGDDLGCAIVKYFKFQEEFGGSGGLGEALHQVQMTADFKREMDFIILDVAREQNFIQSSKGQDLLEEARETAEDWKENPPAELWDAMEPPCRQQFFGPMPFDTGFGGGFDAAGFDPFAGGPATFGGPADFGPAHNGFLCSVDELISHGSPRSLFDAAWRVDDEERQKEFAGQICEDARFHIEHFEEIVANAPASAKAEGEDLLKKGKALLGKCESTDDKFEISEKFDKLGRAAEKWMASAGVNFGDFGPADGDFDGDFDLGGVKNLIGDEDLAAKIDALIEERVAKAVDAATSALTRVFEEKLTKMASKFGRVLDEVTAVVEGLDEEVGEQFGRTLELAAALPDSANEIAEEVLEDTTDTLTILEGLKSEDDLEREVERVQEIITERPLPPTIVAAVKDKVEDASTVLRNGGDAGSVLKEAREIVSGLSEEELNKAAVQAGLQSFKDVTPGKDWYDVAAQEAATEGVVNGSTDSDGLKKLDPGKVLNATEGLTMIANAAGIPEIAAGPEVKGLGLPEWAEDRVQGLANEIGIKKIQEAIGEAGGAGGEMRRDMFADVSIEVYEKYAGDKSISAGDKIGHYVDFGQMDDDEKHDFAVAHEIGMITGAEGGTKANFDGQANRAEAAKMLTKLKEVIEEETF